MGSSLNIENLTSTAVYPAFIEELREVTLYLFLRRYTLLFRGGPCQQILWGCNLIEAFKASASSDDHRRLKIRSEGSFFDPIFKLTVKLPSVKTLKTRVNSHGEFTLDLDGNKTNFTPFIGYKYNMTIIQVVTQCQSTDYTKNNKLMKVLYIFNIQVMTLSQRTVNIKMN